MPTQLQKASARFKSCIKINTEQTGTVSCGNNSGFDLTSEITIEAWVKLGFNADRTSTTYETIVAKSDANILGKLNYWLYLYGKRLGFQFKKADLTVYSLEVDSGDAIPVGQWVHLAATFKDSTDEIKLYINGVLKKSRSDADGTPATTTNDVTIGKMKIGTSNYCYEILGNSCIDEVRISNVARTSFDIIAPVSSDGNTIALYHFDEGSGTVADNAEGTGARDASVPEGWWAQEVDENSIVSDGDIGDNIIAIINASTETTKIDAAQLEATTDAKKIAAGNLKDDGITGTKLADAVAGNGLSKDGSENLQVNVDDSTIEINADILRLKDSGITNAKVNDSAAIAQTKIAGGTTVDDTVTPAASATDLKNRLDMFANRIKDIIGATTGGWLGSISASLKTLWDKFNDSTGRKHTGTGNDAPKIDKTGLADNALAADTTGRAKMEDGFLSADTTGRAKMADGYVNVDKLATDAVEEAKIKNGAVTLSKIEDKFFAYGQAYRSSDYTLTQASWDTLELTGGNNNLKNVSHSASTNPHRVTVAYAGVYKINFSVAFKGGASDSRNARLSKNASMTANSEQKCQGVYVGHTWMRLIIG
ncbi:MAG: LamG domain-containing protein [Candidatus Firestonebacteria bacterium]